MIVIRWFSLLLIVLALMLLGADIVSTLEMPGAVVVRPLEKIFMLFGFQSRPWVEANFAPWLVNPSLAVLASPGWAILGILGVIFSLLAPSRRPKPKAAPNAPPIEH
jgi:hypothetical protein